MLGGNRQPLEDLAALQWLETLDLTDNCFGAWSMEPLCPEVGTTTSEHSVSLASGTKKLRTGQSAASSEAGSFTVVETVTVTEGEWSTEPVAGCPFPQQQRQQQPPPSQQQPPPSQSSPATSST